MESRALIQGSPEWKSARAGSLGASQICDALARTKSGWGASRATLMGQLIAERLSGVPTDSFTNAAMQWGVSTEPQAREAYRAQMFDAVEEVGLVLHPTIKGTHASPDGLVGSDGLLEIKCPNCATHIDTLLSQKIPEKYVTQMTWQIACTGRAWCDFVSFDPRLPENMQLFVKRLERDDKRISEMEEMVQEFLAELDAKVTALKALYEKEAA